MKLDEQSEMLNRLGDKKKRRTDDTSMRPWFAQKLEKEIPPPKKTRDWPLSESDTPLKTRD